MAHRTVHDEVDRAIPLAVPVPETGEDEVVASPPLVPLLRRPLRFQIPPRYRKILAVALVAVWWVAGLITGWGETVIAISPAEMRGSLGRDTPTGQQVSAELAHNATQWKSEMLAPSYELRIGAGSLDRSTENFEEFRLLPAAPVMGRWRIATTWVDLPGDFLRPVEALLGWVREVGWYLTGRKVRHLRMQVLAADGRLTMTAWLDSKTLTSESVVSLVWHHGIRPIAEALFYDVDHGVAAAWFYRAHRYDAAASALEPLLNDHDPHLASWARTLQALMNWEVTGDMRTPLALPRGQALDPGIAASQLIRIKDYTGARRMLNNALKAHPHKWTDIKADQDWTVIVDRTYLDLTTVHLDDAFELLDAAWKPAPPAVFPVIKELMALVQAELHRDADSWRLYTELKGADPADARLRNNFAVRLYLKGYTERARTLLTEIPPDAPRRAGAIETMAVLDTDAGQFGEAANRLQFLTRYTPMYPSIWIHAARIPFVSGEYGAARAILTEAHAALPRNPEIAMQLAYVCGADGDAAAAEPLLAEALNNGGTAVRVTLYQAHVALLTGDLARAETLYGDAVDWHEESRTAQYGRGVTRFINGDYAGSAEDFLAFLKVHPEHRRGLLFGYAALLHFDPARAAKVLPDRTEDSTGRPWIDGIVGLYRDGTPIEHGDPGETEVEHRRRECTRGMHEGLYWLAHGDQQKAKEAFQRSVATGLKHHFEYSVSAAMLTTPSSSGSSSR
ncbi:MAG: tetratricopeptide repeat protein [bacterium]